MHNSAVGAPNVHWTQARQQASQHSVAAVAVHVRYLGRRWWRWWRRRRLIFGRWLVQQHGAGEDDQVDSLAQIILVYAVTALQSSGCHGGTNGKQLGAVALYTATAGLLHQVLDLVWADGHLLQVLTRQDDLIVWTERKAAA